MSNPNIKTYGNFSDTVNYVPNPNEGDTTDDILRRIEGYCKQIADAVASPTIMQEVNLTALFGNDPIDGKTFNVHKVEIYNPYNAIIYSGSTLQNELLQIGFGVMLSQSITADLTFDSVSNPIRLPFARRTDSFVSLAVIGDRAIGTLYICNMRG